MHDQDERELLGAWALDALDEAEHEAVERALSRDPELRAEGRALREVAARLADAAAVPAPAELRAHVLGAISGIPQEQPGRAGGAEGPRHLSAAGPARDADAPSGSPAGTTAAPSASADVVQLSQYRARRRERWIAAAVVLVAAAVPSVLAVEQGRRAEQAEERIVAVEQALAEPGAELVSGDVAGGGRAVAVVGAGAAVFAADGLAELSADEVYQLWVIGEGGAESAGVLVVDDGRASTELAEVPPGAVLAMTVEPAGGSPQPTSDPIVAITAVG